MTLSPIPKALFTFFKHKVNALLIGGQACILYGAAEFSRDIDLTVMISAQNLKKLQTALDDLEAERIFVPGLSEDVLMKGHACHFRCKREDVEGLRIDIIGVMRGVDPFTELWNRRKEVELPGVGIVAVMSLPDLVKAKKTQRDKDWPMIRRLIEADIYNSSSTPSNDRIYFWFTECRTPELLISLAGRYPDIASRIIINRPLLRPAMEGNQEEIQRLLWEEEERERELDRQYWAPLKAELEIWRRQKK